jgi:hypothetical protein
MATGLPVTLDGCIELLLWPLLFVELAKLAFHLVSHLFEGLHVLAGGFGFLLLPELNITFELFRI